MLSEFFYFLFYFGEVFIPSGAPRINDLALDSQLHRDDIERLKKHNRELRAM